MLFEHTTLANNCLGPRFYKCVPSGRNDIWSIWSKHQYYRAQNSPVPEANQSPTPKAYYSLSLSNRIQFKSSASGGGFVVVSVWHCLCIPNAKPFHRAKTNRCICTHLHLLLIEMNDAYILQVCCCCRVRLHSGLWCPYVI